MEGNFNLEDVTLAYILGVACTPNMGPRDPDDWQFFGGKVPADVDVNDLIASRIGDSLVLTNIELFKLTKTMF